MSEGSMREKIVAALDSIWNAGLTPWVLVRLPIPGLPEAVRQAWQSRGAVPFDLDAKFPLDLVYTDEGINVSLAFNHVVARCVLPWGRIAIVARRDQNTPVYDGVSPHVRDTPAVAIRCVRPDYGRPCECIRRGLARCVELCAESKHPDPELAPAPAPFAEPVSDPATVHQRRGAFRVLEGGKK